MTPRSPELSWFQRLPEGLLEGLRNWLDHLLVAYRAKRAQQVPEPDFQAAFVQWCEEVNRLDLSQAQPPTQEYAPLIEKYRRQELDL